MFVHRSATNWWPWHDPIFVFARFGKRPATWLNYKLLSLEDIYLGYPGQFEQNHPVHRALAKLKPQERLTMQAVSGMAVGLWDESQTCVARLSVQRNLNGQKRVPRFVRLEYFAMVQRSSDQDTDKKGASNIAFRSGRSPGGGHLRIMSLERRQR
jgi:hypothetical protein